MLQTEEAKAKISQYPAACCRKRYFSLLRRCDTGALIAGGATSKKNWQRYGEQAFNIREGIEARDVQLPDRMKGIPAQTKGLFADVTIDIENLAREYRQTMDWDADTASPTDETLEKLCLAQLVAEFG